MFYFKLPLFGDCDILVYFMLRIKDIRYCKDIANNIVALIKFSNVFNLINYTKLMDISKLNIKFGA